MGITSSDAAEKRHLLDAWLAAHAPENTAPLLAVLSPQCQLSAEAEVLLKRVDRAGTLALYIVCLGDLADRLTPAYIGKATSAWSRWSNGHLRGLRAAQRTGAGSYARWLEVFASSAGAIPLICLTEGDITVPPIPGFPATVGAVEYQLVSLTAEAYPQTLLNTEGVAR